MHILLVEPNYQIRLPNVALMKFSAKHKLLGDTTEYIKGEKEASKTPDIIYISTIFTYYAFETIRCINYYKDKYGISKIQVGGVFATLMPEYIFEKTGIKPFIGCIDELDRIKPDYDIVQEMIKYSPYIKKYEDFSILFSTRGCIRKCGFCVVAKVEPNHYVIDNWKELIDTSKKCIMFQDNNLTSAPIEHFKDVMKYVIDNNLYLCLNNGLDCRIISEEQMQIISKVKWYPGGLRFAFDNMSEDVHLQRVVTRLLELGVTKGAFLIYCLYNFTDDFNEAMYRFSECRRLKVRPYPQIYRPHDSLVKKEVFVSEWWNLELIREFRNYWYLAGNYKYKTFEEFLATKGKKIEDLNIKVKQ